MCQTLEHRGPDSFGVWFDHGAGIALGHRRLSIVDLSPQGHQPMVSASGRYVMSYNGEIYNCGDLRAELESSARFRGHSDTEVMLAGFERWGIERAVRRFLGMFAFALWDRGEHKLYLVRDRLGEKPLYYGWMGDTLLFGSELKALRAHPDWRGEINREAVAAYVRYAYVPAPFSIYKGVYKLLPGTILCLDCNCRTELPSPQPYWSAKDAAEAGIAERFTSSESELAAQLEALLRDAIRNQMVADVPLGAFLSGGIDSSTIVALMQAQSVRPVRTFTIGFHESQYNEAEHAKAVATHLRTDHTELYVTPEEARAVIPSLPEMYDEPFADSSQIPTHLVARLARKHVTVSLSGDGGDEVFGGYTRYLIARRLWSRIRFLPVPIRRAIAAGLTSLAPQQWDRLFAWSSRFLPQSLQSALPGEKLHKLAEALLALSPNLMYRTLASIWKDPIRVVTGATEPTTVLSDEGSWPILKDFVERMMCVDTVTYLPDDILVKVDRATMAVSLESRAPFLDHRVVEFAYRLPMRMKLRDTETKWLLRQILYQYVPADIFHRPKMGFGVPTDEWLRGPLRSWAEELLSEQRLRREGYFDPQPIRDKWAEHLSGRRNWRHAIWVVLMFEAWLAEERKRTSISIDSDSIAKGTEAAVSVSLD